MAEYVCELVERPAEAPIMVLARRIREACGEGD